MKRILLTLFLLFVAVPSNAVTVWGVDINGLDVQTGLIWIKNSVGDSAPDPICNTLGVAVPFRFLSNYTFRPEVQLFFLNYAYENGRAVPIESMFDSVTIMTLMINPTFGYEYAFTPFLSVNAEGGLAFFTRVPVFFNGKTGGDQALPSTGWLLSRLVYPNLGVGMTWQFSPLFALLVRGQTFFPIFNLWDSSAVWWDQYSNELSIGIRFTF